MERSSASFTPSQEQQAIIDQTAGAVLVLAPVGSGKTQTLALRVAEAIARGTAPSRILCLSFTNRSAREIRTRIQQVVGQAAHAVTATTFHGLCAAALRADADLLGVGRDFTTYDDEDCIALLARLSRSLRVRDSGKELFYRFSGLKAQAAAEQLQLPQAPAELAPSSLRDLFAAYQQQLAAANAVDFADLVYGFRSLLAHAPRVAAFWAERYDLIQVDEVQDTSCGEYEVVRHLARRSGNLALIGDLDQTIYAWRGSNPARLIRMFQADFQPVALPLTENHRTTRQLLAAGNDHAACFGQRHTRPVSAEHCEEGEAPRTHEAATLRDEAAWIAGKIQRLRREQPELRLASIGVLTRINATAVAISRVFTELGLPHVTVEAPEFFRRQEVKDGLAVLRLLLNPGDVQSAHRLLLRVGRGIGPATLREIDRLPGGVGLGAFLQAESYQQEDPYGHLIDAVQAGTVTVFDTETTGLAPAHDRIIELAAVRLEHGVVTAEFERLLRSDVPVGDSTHVHGYSDADLAARGVDPREALGDFLAFAGPVLAGHNVGFDEAMLRSNLHRLGLTTPEPRYVDTLGLARQLLDLRSYRLADIQEHLGLEAQPTHQALNDVRCTAAVLQALVERLVASAPARVQAFARYRAQFEPLAQVLAELRQALLAKRPVEVLDRALAGTGLDDCYRRDPQRVANLERLLDALEQRDDTALDPASALREFLDYAALARNVDHLAGDEDRVPLITIHQAKGTEYEVVFIAGAREGLIPWPGSDEEEERRVHYVALTRARRQLFVSSHVWAGGREHGWSRFVAKPKP